MIHAMWHSIYGNQNPQPHTISGGGGACVIIWLSVTLTKYPNTKIYHHKSLHMTYDFILVNNNNITCYLPLLLLPYYYCYSADPLLHILRAKISS